MSRAVMQMALDEMRRVNAAGIFEGELDEAIRKLETALAEPEQEPVNKYCCHACFNKSGQFFLDRMILCPKCGNKRCPKASHHDLPCTNSNEPGQEGSIYTAPTPRKWVGLTDEDFRAMGFSSRPGAYAAIEAKLKEKNT